ncbi:MAG: chemotaxis protein CheW [Lachnospiraceae bacterium]|nr:chemotaxis protein CheW [Lachnospiraceae bacterium]
MQLLTFTLGGIDFGIPLKDLELIEGRSNEIVEVPAASEYIKGIVTIRDCIVPIYSLALRFGYSEEKLRYFIIVNVEGMRLGIEADRVNSVVDTEKAEVLSVPQLLDRKDNYLKNIVTASQNRLIILIDVNSLIPHEEKAKIYKIINENI